MKINFQDYLTYLVYLAYLELHIHILYRYMRKMLYILHLHFYI